MTLIAQLCNGNKSAFAKKIGVVPSVIGNITGERKGSPSFEVIEKMIYAFEDLNADWLLTGRGSMLREGSVKAVSEPVAEYNSKTLVQEVSDLSGGISLRIRKIISDLFGGNKSEFARNVGIAESVVRSYLTGTLPKADVLEKIARSTAISCDWLILGEGDMLIKKEISLDKPSASTDERLMTLIHEKDIKIEELAKKLGRLEAELDALHKKTKSSTDAGDVTCVAVGE